jgi:hypothetical protein
VDPKQARRMFWWTRSRLLERGHAWEDVRGMTPKETADQWLLVRAGGWRPGNR